MSRLIEAGEIVFDQLDFYQSVFPNRIEDIPVSSLEFKVFNNNMLMPWTFVDGTNVQDGQIAANVLYFNQISGNPGYYQIRFFPDRIGFWRVIVKYPTFSIEIIREYDAKPNSSVCDTGGGLQASFTGGDCC